MRNRILALQIQHPIPRAHPFRKGKTADRTHGRFTNPRGGSSFATTFIGILNSRFSSDGGGSEGGNEVLQGYVAEWMQKRGMDYTPNTW